MTSSLFTSSLFSDPNSAPLNCVYFHCAREQALSLNHLFILFYKDDTVVRVRPLQSKGCGFESRSLPMLLVEVSSPHIDPSLPCPTWYWAALNRCVWQYSVKSVLVAPEGALIPNKLYIVLLIYYRSLKLTSNFAFKAISLVWFLRIAQFPTVKNDVGIVSEAFWKVIKNTLILSYARTCGIRSKNNDVVMTVPRP